MKLSEALTRIGTTSATKTAAAAPTTTSTAAPASDAGDRLRQALKEATAPDASTKTASQASPIEDMTKIAADLSKAEHEALVKEAQLYGAAICDGFMARAAQYEDATRKVAAAQPAIVTSTMKVAGDDSFDKFAAAEPELVKQAAELGYATTVQQLEKLAEDAYAKGWNDTMAQVHKIASDVFVEGFKRGQALVEAATR
jgi:hypothetical protein